MYQPLERGVSGRYVRVEFITGSAAEAGVFDRGLGYFVGTRADSSVWVESLLVSARLVSDKWTTLCDNPGWRQWSAEVRPAGPEGLPVCGRLVATESTKDRVDEYRAHVVAAHAETFGHYARYHRLEKQLEGLDEPLVLGKRGWTLAQLIGRG